MVEGTENSDRGPGHFKRAVISVTENNTGEIRYGYVYLSGVEDKPVIYDVRVVQYPVSRQPL